MGIIRKTKSVKILLEAIDKSQNAVAVVDLVKEFKIKMNKTTVYRILERLELDGIIHSFTGKDGRKWVAKYDEAQASNHPDVHPHFQCNDCGKSECIDVDVTIPKVPKYKIDSVNFILVGQCEDCLA